MTVEMKEKMIWVTSCVSPRVDRPNKHVSNNGKSSTIQFHCSMVKRTYTRLCAASIRWRVTPCWWKTKSKVGVNKALICGGVFNVYHYLCGAVCKCVSILKVTSLEWESSMWKHDHGFVTLKCTGVQGENWRELLWAIHFSHVRQWSSHSHPEY